MGHNGSRVIQIKKIEDHLNQCEELGTRRKTEYTQGVPSTDNYNVYATRTWISTSPAAIPTTRLIQCPSTTSSFQTTSSSLTSPSSKISIPPHFQTCSPSSAESAKWALKADTWVWATTESPIKIVGESLGNQQWTGLTSRSGKRASQKGSSFPLSR